MEQFKQEISLPVDDWADPISDESFAEGTNRPDLLAEEYKTTILNKGFSYSFPNDFLIINDVVLENIPLTGIRFSSKSEILVAETIRTSSPIISPKGKEDFLLQLSLIFKPGKSQQIKLRRLLASLSKNPYTFIFNNYIKKALKVSEFENTIFVLETGTLRTTNDTVGIVVLDLSFHYFNYKPYSNHFYFNKNLAGIQIKDSTKNANLEQSISQPYLDGYEYGDFVKSLYSEQLIKNLNESFLSLQDIKKNNSPTIFPSESAAWMYYVDELEKNIPKITDTPSDYIGISVKEYKYFPPPDEAKLGEKISSYNEKLPWKEIVYPYKKDETRKTYQEENIEILTSVGTLPSETKIQNTKTGKTISVNLFTDTGNINEQAVEEINLLWRVGKYADTEKIKYSAVYKLGQIARKYPGRTIKIISATRKQKPGGRENKHVTGHAFDLKVNGISNLDLVNYLKTLKMTGVGYYPNSTFVHVDYRDQSYDWIDLSGSGEKSKYLSKLEKDQYWKTHISTANNESNADLDEIVPKAEYQEDLNRKKGGKALEVYESTIKKSNKNKTSSSSRSKSESAREAWIASKESEGWYLYTEDSAIRNTFYKKYSVDISGDHFLQKQNLVLPNIVCSAISLSFGHRIVPHKFIGQPYPSYQFLGSGNKVGQIIFTFAGDEGITSVSLIKDLIYKARDNARNFGHSIKDAGCINLSSLSQINGEQNILLALLGFENIVISNIEESNSSDGSDKYQLLIEFLVQDFQEEEIKKSFTTTLDSKRQLISKLMEMVSTKKTSPGLKSKNTSLFGTYSSSDFTSFFPSPNIAKTNSDGTYTPAPNVPDWISSVVGRVSKFCESINNKMPPTVWKQNTGTGKTWRENYGKWGAGNHFNGMIKNIPSGERNGDSIYTTARQGSMPVAYGLYQGFTIDKPKEKDHLPYEEMYNGNFEYNGGNQTNKVHKDVFSEWLSGMESFVREINSHLSDEEEFKKFFGSVGEDMLNSVSGYTGECYKDLSLPKVPGSRISLPPEFYVYDDSDEDPMISNFTNQDNLIRQMEEHSKKELNSIKNFITDSYLGGSYLSKNLPRILENRAMSEEKFLSNELEHLDDYSALFRNGLTVWEPIYFRDDPSISQNSGVTKWKNEIKKNLGGGTEIEQRLQFMDNIVSLSSYLKDGRKWETPYTDSDKQGIVESIYGDAWDKIEFGPNQDYIKSDSVVSGVIPNNINSLQPKPLEKKKLVTSQVSLSDVLMTFGNAVTASSLHEAEQASENWKLNTTLAESALEVIKSIPSKYTSSFIEGMETTHSSPGYSNEDVFNIITENANAISESLKTNTSSDNLTESQKNITQDKLPNTIAKISSGIALGQKKSDLSFRRAFPTLKIFLIEDDSKDTYSENGKVVRAFDDFYSYSAIQEVTITRSRKIASDMAVIRITNIGGKILRERFGQEDTYTRDTAKERQGIFADTELENPFEKMVLQDGIKIQIRLGYSGNPDYLETVFLGQIVETSLVDNGKIIELVCQGYGAELESVELGPLEDGPVFYSSQQVLSGAIIQESIANFGRQSKFNRFNPAEVRHAWTGGNGKGLLGSLSPSNLISQWSDSEMDKLFAKFTFLNEPQDDNIFAPPPDIYATAWNRFWNNACIYRPIRQTPWQIFKEHELRHPGYISLAVPYGHSSRMTMFFGAKSQHYWSRPPTALEIFVTENMANDILRLRSALGFGNYQKDLNKKLSELSVTSPQLANSLIEDLLSSNFPDAVNENLSKMFGRYVPFRNFHYLDSSHHIIKNEIRTSVDGTFNEVEIFYADDEDLFDKGTIYSPIGHLLGVTETAVESEAERLTQGLQQISNGESGVLTVKLDENLPESSIRSYREEFPSCVTSNMAKRYAQGLFARHLRDAYKGELVVSGKEKLKPYDVCLINDSVNQMTGPIEVEAVTHIFNQDVGFVSIITPDLCVEVNDMYSVSVVDMTLAAMSYVWPFSDVSGKLAAILSPGLAGVGFLAMLGGVKFLSWTQDGDPVMVTPLSFGGKPFISVSLGSRNSSLFLNLAGEWRQYWDDLKDAWNKLDLSEAFLDFSIDISVKINSLLGTGSQGGVI